MYPMLKIRICLTLDLNLHKFSKNTIISASTSSTHSRRNSFLFSYIWQWMNNIPGLMKSTWMNIRFWLHFWKQVMHGRESNQDKKESQKVNSHVCLFYISILHSILMIHNVIDMCLPNSIVIPNAIDFCIYIFNLPIVKWFSACIYIQNIVTIKISSYQCS